MKSGINRVISLKAMNRTSPDISALRTNAGIITQVLLTGLFGTGSSAPFLESSPLLGINCVACSATKAPAIQGTILANTRNAAAHIDNKHTFSKWESQVKFSQIENEGEKM